MNDDVKAAIERFHTWEFDGLDARDHATLLAHIDGEPARIAAACEEVREAVARHVMGPALKRDPDLFADHLEEVYAATIRRMPLTATPLADALRLANESVIKLAKEATEAQARATEGVRYWTDLAQAEARDAAALRARVAELERDSAAMTVTANAEVAAGLAIAAERDALRAWVSAVSEALGAIEPVSDCRVELSANAAAALAESLRAQVEAARKVCELRIKTQWRVPDVYITAHDVLAAMDGAKP